MADIKKSLEGGERKMKTSPRMSRPKGSAHFSSFSFFSCRARKEVSLLSSLLSQLSTSSAPAFEDTGSLSNISAASTQAFALGSQC